MDLWTRSDIERSLTALARVAARYDRDGFSDGYRAALGDVAAAFGLNLDGDRRGVRPGRRRRCGIIDSAYLGE